MNAATIGGYAVGAALVSLFGAGWALTIDASSFLLSACLLAGVHGGGAAAGTSVSPALLAQVRAGWREFASRPWVWAMSGQAACINISVSGLMVLGPLVAVASFGAARGWGTVLACQAVGAVAGSLAATRVRPRRPLRAAVLLSAGLVPLLLAVAGRAPLAVVVVTALLSGAAASVYEVLIGTTLQQRIPPAALSQIMACDEFGSFLVVPASFAAAGPLAAAVGVTPVLAGAGLLIAVSGILGLLMPSVRTLRSPAERSDAIGVAGPVALSADGRLRTLAFQVVRGSGGVLSGSYSCLNGAAVPGGGGDNRVITDGTAACRQMEIRDGRGGRLPRDPGFRQTPDNGGIRHEEGHEHSVSSHRY
jgi:hypothetical protein